MMRTIHYSALIFLWVNLFFTDMGFASERSDKMINQFKFYKIGGEDTVDTAAEKLDTINYHCVRGNATFLETKSVQNSLHNQKASERIKELVVMDEVLEDHGRGLEIEEMPIEALVCTPPDKYPFSTSAYFFSGFEKKLLTFWIKIRKIDMVREKLVAKFGYCVKEGYCEGENSVLFLVDKNGWHLHVYFFNNIKSHYERIKRIVELNNEKIKENINEAF